MRHAPPYMVNISSKQAGAAIPGNSWDDRKESFLIYFADFSMYFSSDKHARRTCMQITSISSKDDCNPMKLV
jgi:hypothetical protein